MFVGSGRSQLKDRPIGSLWLLGVKFPSMELRRCAWHTWGNPAIYPSYVHMNMLFLRGQDKSDYVAAMVSFICEQVNGYKRPPAVYRAVCRANGMKVCHF